VPFAALSFPCNLPFASPSARRPLLASALPPCYCPQGVAAYCRTKLEGPRGFVRRWGEAASTITYVDIQLTAEAQQGPWHVSCALLLGDGLLRAWLASWQDVALTQRGLARRWP